MGYVAVKGGLEAVAQAELLSRYFRVRGGAKPLEPAQIRDQLRLAVDRAMSEGSLYAPDLAALALKQAEGDPLEASFLLRAYRSTQPRDFYSLVAEVREMRVLRRISATFKDIPGGQLLGPTRDYTIRLLDFDLRKETTDAIREFIRAYLTGVDGEGAGEPATFPKVIDLLREQGLLKPAPSGGREERPAGDLTRDGLSFPAPRALRLQALTRGETGGMVTLAYTTMRGYGNIHPTLGELRVGYLPLRMRHPVHGEPVTVGEVLVTEAEVISQDLSESEERPVFTVGYGLCFGQNEEKAIAMAILERAMDTAQPTAPAQDEEFVLSHIDGIEAAGFTAHWKLPHYVTFQSALDRLRKARADQHGRKG
jgi:alpha-D-ribose 1-methylphosphonate 5-triphosphate synthase subunit PhnI